MTDYSVNLTIQTIWNVSRIFLDVLIMWFLIYYVIKFVRNNARTIQIFKGIVFIIIINGLAKILGLGTVEWLSNMVVSWGFLAVIIIFVPEIRSVLEKLGKSNVFSKITTLSGNEKEHLVDEIVKASMILSRQHTGALICIEQGQSLQDYVKTGIILNSVVSTELITSLFVTSTPLHDGAVIIQGNKIACASAYFPPTNLELPSKYGSRHRAAIGMSEITDSVTIVISEETGSISIADGGKIITVNRKELRNYLMRVICNEETELKYKEEQHSEFVVLDSPDVVVEKKQDKSSFFNKFTIRRQNKKVKPEKQVEVIEENVQELQSKEEEIFKELEEEENNIKLPDKRKFTSFEDIVKQDDDFSYLNLDGDLEILEISTKDEPISPKDQEDGGEQNG
ncbi:MAG: diadenylate cyclase CdaA [Erysipelotrichaceae bacterium]|nr:diadenylate cyclase CdaA [Erysipelotrichaceae bacterium]